MSVVGRYNEDNRAVVPKDISIHLSPAIQVLQYSHMSTHHFSRDIIKCSLIHSPVERHQTEEDPTDPTAAIRSNKKQGMVKGRLGTKTAASERARSRLLCPS